MATSIITGTIQDPTGTALSGITVVARLLPRPCFVTSSGVELAPLYSTTTNASGVYTLTLTETADITPADSYYEVTEYIPDRYGGPVKHTIQVGASNVTVYASLVTSPPATATNTYLTQAAGDARYQAITGYAAAGDLSVIEPDDSASAGVLTSAARSDHQHAVAAAVAGTIEPDDAAAEGVATSFSRSDHKHAIATVTAGASRPADAAAEGVATSFSRSDHKHSRETISGTAAARAALSGADLFEGLWFRETDGSDKLYLYRASAWLQVADTIVVADSTARTAITAAYEGMQVYQLDTNTIYTYDGSSWWSTGIAGNGTTSYTPTLAQGVSTNISKTVNKSIYRIIDGVCEWWFRISPTASGTAGSPVTLTLPVTTAMASPEHIGAGMVYDSSAGTIDTGSFELTSTTTVAIATGEGTVAPWGQTPNIAIASGDEIRGHVRFPVASAA